MIYNETMEEMYLLALLILLLLIVFLIIFLIRLKHFNSKFSSLVSRLDHTRKRYAEQKSQKELAYAKLGSSFKDALKIYSLWQIFKYLIKKDKRKPHKLTNAYLANQKYIDRLIR